MEFKLYTLTWKKGSLKQIQKFLNVFKQKKIKIQHIKSYEYSKSNTKRKADISKCT